MVSKLLRAITRKKTLDSEEPKTNLARVLSLLDLVLLGAGSTLGLGVYILAGSVAKIYAGPAVCISFLIAAVISLFGGLCYAEFAARVPRTGYAYAYCYAGVGELVAFIVGWNLLLGAVLGASSVASGMSSYLDTLVDKKISLTLRDWLPIDLPYLVTSPDFLALGIIILLTVLLSVGMKESSIFNNTCTALNLFTIFTVIVACAIKADTKNWKISVDEIHPPEDRTKAGSGGFFPYGITGVIAGAPNCFYGFTGFDAAAGCSDEAKNPKRDIPLAILISLFLVFVVYFTISTVLTLAWPYYLQNEVAPFTYVFDQFGWVEVKWIVSIGAIFALSSSAFGGMYFVPRVFYAMAEDGLIFKFLANVHPTTKTPLVSTILSGSLAGLLAAFLNLEALMDLMTIGAFFSYVIVAASVIVLRYENNSNVMEAVSERPINNNKKHYFGSLFNISKRKIPTKTSSIVTNISTMFFIIISTVFCIIVKEDSFFSSKNMQYITCSTAALLMLVIMFIIFRQPESNAKISFKVPLVPLIPCLSIVFNIYLMMQLSSFTWIGFLGWIAIGCVVYFFYGIKHSVLNNKEEKSTEEVKI